MEISLAGLQFDHRAVPSHQRAQRERGRDRARGGFLSQFVVFLFSFFVLLL